MSFKNGHSYISINDKDNIGHVLVKALKEKGYKDFNLIFAPKWSNNAGWETLEGSFIPLFLGFTKKEALDKISTLKTFKEELAEFDKDYT